MISLTLPPLRLCKGSGFSKMKLRGTFFVIWKVLDYKYYKSEFQQLTNRITVPLRYAIRTRAGSNPARFLGRSLVRSRFSFYTAFLKCFSCKFLVNRELKDLLVDVCSNTQSRSENKLTPIRYRAVVGVPDESVLSVRLLLVTIQYHLKLFLCFQIFLLKWLEAAHLGLEETTPKEVVLKLFLQTPPKK